MLNLFISDNMATTIKKDDNIEPGFWIGLLIVGALLVFNWLRANGKI